MPSALFDLPVTLDEKDRPLMCAAIRAGCAHFATGDRRDFGHLFDKVVEKVLVVNLLRLAPPPPPPPRSGPGPPRCRA